MMAAQLKVGDHLEAVTRDVTNDKMIEFEKVDRKSTRLNSSHIQKSRMPSSA